MLLLRTIAIVTGSSLNDILNFKLVVKLRHKKMRILRSILPPPPPKKKIKPPPDKNLTCTPGKSRTP